MKKFLVTVFCIVMTLSMSTTAFAADLSADLSEIAASTIQVEKVTDDAGNIVTTFLKLDDFQDAVRLAKPEISDYEIALYILQYTDQDYSSLSEEDVLSFLAYDNITTSSCYVGIDCEGNAHVSNDDVMSVADWSSSDGYMKISTNYSYIKTVKSEKYYSVWSTASWIKYPAVCMQDAFVLGTTGVFDDSYDENGSVAQNFYCISCRNTTVRKRSVSSTMRVDNDLTLEYANFVPMLRFEPISPRCDYCGGGGSRDSKFNAYIRYGIIANKSVNIQAGYAHKTLGIGNINVGIGLDGTPSFSASGSKISKYVAKPVTIKY